MTIFAPIQLEIIKSAVAWLCDSKMKLCASAPSAESESELAADSQEMAMSALSSQNTADGKLEKTENDSIGHAQAGK